MEILTFPYIITCPGKYYITQDIVFSSPSNTIENLITVNVNDVTIDLMGHSLSISTDYRYKNRWFNLIYSKCPITVINGTLGLTSGYSIKSDSSVHCTNVIFTLYELGAIISNSYISLNACTILSPNSTNTIYTYDYSRRIITITFDMITKHSNTLPITSIGQLSQYIATLENLLDFALEQFKNSIYDIRFFSPNVSYRTTNILKAPKIKICDTKITINDIHRYTYQKQTLTMTSNNSVIFDIDYYPLQYDDSVTIPELSNVIWYSGSLVNTYNLPYYSIPQDILDAIKNLQISIPNGYTSVFNIYPIVVIDCNNLKIYDTILIIGDNITSITINNSRYVRCIDCNIGGVINILSSSSVRITSSTLNSLEIYSSSCLELSDNIITLLKLHNISPNNNNIRCNKK